MKIIFICGSLESGKDGVGDYTRRLCGELVNQGMSVGILSYYDKHVDNVLEENQFSDGNTIACFRLPNNLKSYERRNLASKWIEDKNPDWLSLQFVPYSFNSRGLPLGLSNQLKKIGGKNVKWHIMFHELWLGLRDSDSVKYKAIGLIQRSIVKSILAKIIPKVIHTHTQFYLFELKKNYLNPEYLPIFSNIPLNKSRSQEVKSKINEVCFVIFGTIHPNAPIKDFANEISNYFKKHKDLKCSFTLVGKSGNEAIKWIKELELLGIQTIFLGELDALKISHVLQEASFGITTNPIFVVEKSGTVAAMREHNLPILIVSERTKPKEEMKLVFDSDLIEYKKGNFADLIEKKHVGKRVTGLNETCSIFLKSLTIKTKI